MTWIMGNLKWVAIAVAAVALIGLGTKVYSDVKKLGQYEVMIKEYKALIKERDETISMMIADKILIDELTAQRDQELQRMMDEMKNNTKNLPPDIFNPAPESLKEYFRRLRQ